MQLSDALQLTHRRLADDLPTDRPIRVLEAGGGSFTHIRLDRPRHVTVVDISPEQLARNDSASEKILGDLHDEDLLHDTYDLIVCWDVLEHLSAPARAFRNMAKSLAPGGLLVIGCPNLFSLKGLVTRFTPHWFHVQYYRHVRGEALAGQPGRAPFPTYLRSDMALQRIVKQAEGLDLHATVAKPYSGPALEDLRGSHPMLFGLYWLPSALVRVATLGRVDLANTDYVAVFRKAPDALTLRAAA